MCSYNAVNGVPSCADNYLLQTVLREYWEWTAEDQWVTSDCDAVQNIYNASSWNVPKYGHNYTSAPEQAVADALNAGTGMHISEFTDPFSKLPILTMFRPRLRNFLSRLPQPSL
jgi:beta-D-xylosidase 4